MKAQVVMAVVVQEVLQKMILLELLELLTQVAVVVVEK
jgi:hypothetical protein